MISGMCFASLCRSLAALLFAENGHMNTWRVGMWHQRYSPNRFKVFLPNGLAFHLESRKSTIGRWKSWLHSNWALPLLESLLTLLKALPSLPDVDLVMRAQTQETELHGKDPNCKRSEFRGANLDTATWFPRILSRDEAWAATYATGGFCAGCIVTAAQMM